MTTVSQDKYLRSDSLLQHSLCLESDWFVLQEDYYSRGAGQKAWPVRWMAPEQMIVKGTDVLDSHQITTTANVWYRSH